MAGRPKHRARMEAARAAQANGKPNLFAAGRATPKFEYLADIYAERYTTFQALRMAMVQNGIVDHGINPYDVIQRAIDDTTTDYLLLRRTIDKETNGDPNELVDHPLYPYMEHMREAMVRYATFATQYDIQRKQLKLSESRVALLSHTLRDVLQDLGLTHDQVREVPKLLIAQLKSQEPNGSRTLGPSRLNAQKAEAIAEILHHDAEVDIIDVEPIEDTEPDAS